jgi:hypothetical protein
MKPPGGVNPCAYHVKKTWFQSLLVPLRFGAGCQQSAWARHKAACKAARAPAIGARLGEVTLCLMYIKPVNASVAHVSIMLPGASVYTRTRLSLLSYVVFALAVNAAWMASAVLLTKRAPFLSLHCALSCFLDRLADVPHVALCPPVVQSCFWHTSEQYRAVLHRGHTLKSFK